MRLPESMVERAAAGRMPLGVKPDAWMRRRVEDDVRSVLSAALSPEAIRELATGACPFCDGWGEVETGGFTYDGKPYVSECPACKGHRALIAAWLSEPAVLEAASKVDRRWRVDPCLSAAAGALSERSGE